jgi:Flp pilus assembly secretin CpaC
MANVPLTRTLQIAAVIFAFGFIALGQTPAAEQAAPVIQLVAGDSSSRFVPLGVGKSVVIDLPRDIKDVLVADPTIANAVVRTARRAYIIGVKGGQTNVFFFDAEGQQIGGLDIAVTRNLNGLPSSRHCPRPISRSKDWAMASCSTATSRARSNRRPHSTSLPAWSTIPRRSSTASTSTAAIR